METDLIKVYHSLRLILKCYENYFVTKINSENRFELWTNKEVMLNDKKYKEFFFAGLIIQSKYVGFYFMPVYIEPEIKNTFHPELIKLLKGKSCFHIKKIDSNTEIQINTVLKTGLELFKTKGWI